MSAREKQLVFATAIVSLLNTAVLLTHTIWSAIGA